jgi:hypothetical protein
VAEAETAAKGSAAVRAAAAAAAAREREAKELEQQQEGGSAAEAMAAAKAALPAGEADSVGRGETNDEPFEEEYDRREPTQVCLLLSATVSLRAVDSSSRAADSPCS